jgi:hypothetical protein
MVFFKPVQRSRCGERAQRTQKTQRSKRQHGFLCVLRVLGDDSDPIEETKLVQPETTHEPDPGGFAPADPPSPPLAGPHDPRSAPAGAPVARLARYAVRPKRVQNSRFEPHNGLNHTHRNMFCSILRDGSARSVRAARPGDWTAPERRAAQRRTAGRRSRPSRSTTSEWAIADRVIGDRKPRDSIADHPITRSPIQGCEVVRVAAAGFRY